MISDTYQPFLESIRAYYRSKQTNQLVLCGNIWDVFHHPLHKDSMVNLGELLADFLKEKMIIINVDITRGIQFLNDEERIQFEDFYAKWGTARATEAERRRWFQQRLQESMIYPILALNTLREFCSVVRAYRVHENSDFSLLKLKPLCIVIRYAETFFPAGPLARLAENDRQKVTIVRDWFSDRNFLESSELVLLVADTVADINQKIRDLPHVFSINIPYPDFDERRTYIKALYNTYKDRIKMKESQKSLAILTAGLRLNGIEDIFLDAAHRKDEVDRRAVINKVNQVLTKQIGDYIEILEPSHSLADVLGNTALKVKLKELKKRFKSFDPAVVPSGILVSGPNGVGKTFIWVAVAGESGRIPVILKNLRSKWFGETDAVFERITNVLRALGNVIILVDEADTAFGGRSEQSHETEQRLFGNVLKMMSDTKNRGKIIWILLTARPDKLEPDFKRPGRCGLHLPVFDPSGKDREEFIDFILRPVDIKLSSFSLEERQELDRLTLYYSGADFKELSSELLALRKMNPKEFNASDIVTFIRDWIPGDISDKRRLQALYAVLHCSYKSLLPPEFCDTTRDDIEKQISQLRYS